MKFLSKLITASLFTSFFLFMATTVVKADNDNILPNDYMDVGITQGIELDEAGNIYVVDSMNLKILVFNPAGELVRSFGKGGAREEEFSGFIYELTIDNNGYIYVGGNCHIYKFSPAGAFVKRWGECGTEDGQFGAAFGVHYDETYNRIIITDSRHWSLGVENNRVQVFSKDGDFIGKFGGTGTADGQFVEPFGVTTDTDGNIYVVDTFNHRAQKFDKDFNHLATFGSEGYGDGEFTFPKDVRVDSTGRVIVTSQNSARIHVFDSNLDFLFAFGEEGAALHQFQAPQYLDVDSADNIYVNDWAQKAIMKFDSNGVFQTKISNGRKVDGYFVHPNAIVYDSLGDMYVLDDGAYDGRVQKFTNSGVYIDTIIEAGTLMWSTYHMAIDEYDNLYISGNDGVDVFDTSGTYIRTIGDGGGSLPGEFNQARGMDFDANNNIYIADLYNSRVQVFDDTGAYITSFGSVGVGDGEFVATNAVLIDTINNLVYVSDTNDGGVLETEIPIARIQRFDLLTHAYVDTIATAGAEGFDDYQGVGHLEMDSLGNIYAVDGMKNRVQYIQSDGTLISSYGTFGSGLDKLNEPSFATINPINDILSIVDHGNQRIMLKPAGTRIFNLSSEVDAFNTADDQSIVNDYVAFDDPNRDWINATLYAQGTRIAYFGIDLTEDRDWGNVYVASIPEKSKVLISNLFDDGDINRGIVSVYVPRSAGQDKLLVCPNANNVSQIYIGCLDGYALTEDSDDVFIETIGGEGDFWNLGNTTNGGFMSYSTARLDLTASASYVYVNDFLDLTITPVNELDEVDSFYVGDVEIVSSPYTNLAHSTVSINMISEPVVESITFDEPGVYVINAEDIYDPSLSATIESITVLGLDEEMPTEEEEPPVEPPVEEPDPGVVTPPADDDTTPPVIAYNPDIIVEEEVPTDEDPTVEVPTDDDHDQDDDQNGNDDDSDKDDDADRDEDETGFFAAITRAAKAIAERVEEVFNSEAVKTASVVALPLLYLAMSPIPVGIREVLALFVRSYNGILTLVAPKKRLSIFGYVYDSISKSPLSLAIIRFFDKNGGLVMTSVTNSFGRFNIALPTGSYKAVVARTSYKFPSAVIKGGIDSPIANVYHGEFQVFDQNIVNTVSIPMDASDNAGVGVSLITAKSALGSVLRSALWILFGFGFIQNIYLLFTDFGTVPIVMCLFYVLLSVYYMITNQKHSAGKASYRGEAVGNVEVTLSKDIDGEVLDKRFTDEKGHFNFVAVKGVYFININSSIYKISKPIKVIVDSPRPATVGASLELRRKVKA